MEGTSIAVMIFVLSLNWGGFLFCLRLAMKKEKQKSWQGNP